MMEILSLARAGYGGLSELLTLDSPEILDALEWEHMLQQVKEDASRGDK